MKLHRRKTNSLFVFLILFSFFISCTSLEGVNNRLTKIENDIKDMQSAIQALQMAYEGGKIVKAVAPLQSGDGGWIITFSDESTIVLQNGARGADGRDGIDGRDGADGKDGQDGIAPIVRIQPSNYHWEISLDGGITWNDTGITAIGKDGADGKDGVDGKDGRDGISPLMRINGESFLWEVSFDSGITWTSTGVLALGQRGADGRDGRDGSDGRDGRDGRDGADGKDAIPAMMRINPTSLEWELSYDGGVTWLSTGQTSKGDTGAAGISPQVRINAETYEWETSLNGGQTWESTGMTAQGLQGQNGDSFFQSVTMQEDIVTFVMIDGTTFRFKMESDVVWPHLLSLAFFASQNPSQLIQNVSANIIGDSTLECHITHIVEDKLLIPIFEFQGDSVVINGTKAISGQTRHDFSKPVEIQVWSQNMVKTYPLRVYAFTGLPVVWIETADGKDITSREEYVNAHIRIVEDIETRGPGDIFSSDVQIKGRGNSTWELFDKKPYKLKFTEKQSILGEPKSKSWVLLANYADKTQLRNELVFRMGKISNLAYTPHHHFVEMMLNGRYNGTYQLCEQIKTDKNHVNVGNDGFLMEIDSRAAEPDVFFSITHLPQPVVIKEPDDNLTEDDINYLKDFLTNADNILYSNIFRDPIEGWQKVLDMDSFVDYYIITEIAKNNDAFFSSTYMNLERGKKLKIGPLWDYDIAFGNVYYADHSPEGFHVKNVSWYKRLFQDPAFVNKVKERFDYFYSQREDLLREINESAVYLRYSVEENNNRWGTFYTYTWPNTSIWGSYQNEVQQLKKWFNERMEWLNTAIHEL